METLLTWNYGLLVLLAVVLFLAVAWLGKVLLLRRDGPGRQRQRPDRRTGKPMPATPFYDSERRLVTRDRRRGERRGQAIMFTTTQELRARTHRQ